MRDSERCFVGAKFKTNEGYNIEIIEKSKGRLRRIVFLDDYKYEMIVCSTSILRGSISNPYHPSMRGVGFTGVGSHKCWENGRAPKKYSTWRNMFTRCHDEKYQMKKQNYIGNSICEEWNNYQNFGDWFDENFPKHIENLRMDLDKDLLQEGIENKIYSPKTCVFLPERINSFMTNKQKTNTTGEIGVCFSRNRWTVSITDFDTGKKIHIGSFDSKEEASLTYKKYRAKNAEKAKDYLRNLNYLPEHIIQLIK